MTQFAIVQMRTLPLDPAANLKVVLARLDQAAAQGAELAVFPECALTGYFLTSQEAASIAETTPGPRTERLAEACQSLGIYAVVGTIEKDASGHCYNTAVLVGPDGLLGRYRKSHLIRLGVDRFLTPGDSPPAVYDTPLGRLGVLICYDLRFPEPARVLALSGAQAILLPTAWPAAATLYPDFIARTRAAENGVFVLAADHVGEERGARYLGRSIVVGPDGEILAEAGREEETILTAEVDLARSLHKHRIFIPGEYELDLFGDRRPELYSQITTLRE